MWHPLLVAKNIVTTQTTYMTEDENNKSEKSISLGAAFGVALGAAFGSFWGKISLGIALGLCIGVVVGAIFDFVKNRK